MEGPAAVSDSLVYTPRPSAVTGSKIRQNIPCYNLSEANPGRVIMFNIPCGRRGQFLSPRASYFKFRVNNYNTTAGAILTLDYSAQALISRLEVYHGSNLLEQISEYNVLAHILKDIQSGADHQLTVGSALEGISGTRTGEGIAIASAANNPTRRVYSIQLLSGLIGGLQEKYLPVGEMVGDLRLELTLAGANDPFTSPNAPNWTVDQMELILEYVELSDTATAMVAQQNPGGYMLSFDSFANYSSTLGSGVSSMNVLIPARYSVLKTLFTSIRSDANKTAANRTITDRENIFSDTGEWYYAIGGKNMPSTPVKNTAEAYGEMMKAMHALGSVAAPTVCNFASWTTDAHTAYVIAQDLEYLHGKSARASNGVNTLSVNTHLVGRLAGATTVTHTIDTFAHYEGVLMIVNGIAQSQI
jgi:hypothetical protein